MNGYLETAVLTASPARLHGMVADAAVRHAAAAAAALAAGDREAGHRACSKAIGCAAELLAGLTPDAAGDGGGGDGDVKAVTGRLGALFAWCVERLAEADRAGEPAPAADAARVLGVHAQTWRELQAALAGDAAAPNPAAPPAFAAAPGAGGGPIGVSWAA